MWLLGAGSSPKAPSDAVGDSGTGQAARGLDVPVARRSQGPTSLHVYWVLGKLQVLQGLCFTPCETPAWVWAGTSLPSARASAPVNCPLECPPPPSPAASHAPWLSHPLVTPLSPASVLAMEILAWPLSCSPSPSPPACLLLHTGADPGREHLAPAQWPSFHLSRTQWALRVSSRARRSRCLEPLWI